MVGATRLAREQGLGRSGGGPTTKNVFTAFDEGTTVTADVVSGHAHDALQLHQMFDRIEDQVPVEEAVGDFAFDRDSVRAEYLHRGIGTVIPNKGKRTDPCAVRRGRIQRAKPGRAAVRHD